MAALLQPEYGNGRTVVVVGGGPAGALAALMLAERGFRVQVFEKREDPATCDDAATRGRGYVVHVSERALVQIKKTAAVPAFMGPNAQPYHGVIANGKAFAPPPRNPADYTYLAHRTTISRDIIAETKRLYGDRVAYHFHYELSSLDLQARTATFAPTQEAAKGQQAQQVQYDLIVGADGAHSAVREALIAARVPGLTTHQLFAGSRRYKGFTGLPDPIKDSDKDNEVWEIVPGGAKHVCGQHLYFFAPRPPFEPFMMMWREADGTLSGSLISPPTWEEAPLKEFLINTFPALHPSWIDSIVQQIGANGPMPVPARVPPIKRHSQFHGPRAVLVGDAAHNVTPSLGQGCNAALETVGVFVDVLDEVNGDLDAVPQRYSRVRVKDAHALQYVDMMVTPHEPGSAPALQGRLSKATFILCMGATALGAKVSPKRFGPARSVWAVIRKPDTGYSSVLGSMKRRAAAGAVVASAVVGGLALLGVHCTTALVRAVRR